MAFLTKLKIGTREIDGFLGVLRNFKFSGIRKENHVTGEIHVFPDVETYEAWKHPETRKKMDYEKSLAKVVSVTSASLAEEKQESLKKELSALFYKYFAEGEEV